MTPVAMNPCTLMKCQTRAMPTVCRYPGVAATGDMYRASSFAVQRRSVGTWMGVNRIHSDPGVQSLLKYSRGWSISIDSPLRISIVTNRKLKK